MPGGQGQVRFGILGPVEIWTADGAQHVERPLRTAVLAFLLLRAGHLVTVDQLEDALWGGAPPATARPQIHAAVSRIRRVLREAGCADALATRPGGYELTVAGGQLDLAVFDDHAGRARAAAASSRYEAAAEDFRRALGLWRGPALGGATAAFVAAARERLEDKRLATYEDLADAELALGRHAGLTAELGALVDLNPLRERLTGQQMLALYRAGRPAEALDAFHRLRTQLADQLGIDPSRELRERHEAILRADPALDRVAASAAVGVSPPTPRELPGDVAGFTGRDGPLAELDALLDKAFDKTRNGSAMVICAISGTAGVGKTALAVRWAHRVADQFPDGQLYLDLRGYHPDQPMPAGQALAALLNSLGMSTMDLPVDVAGRAARYRTALAGRRALVVLDNVHSADQVRPLLPGTPSCVVVVTSRGDLAGLVARDGARRLALDALAPNEAVRLLHTLIGERVTAEPVAALLLAQRCARLPLPLRIAAELAVASPATSLAQLADDLREQRRRLDLLNTGDDPHTAVRAVLSWSHRHLPREVAAAFGLLGLHPGETFDAYAVAALVGCDLLEAERRMRELARAHLAHVAGSRFRMHDLLRAYAAERAEVDFDADASHAALTRLLDYHLYTATVAVAIAFPAERANLPGLAGLSTPVPVVDTPETALEWLDRERQNLVAAGMHAGRHGWVEQSIHFSQVLWRYLDEHPGDALAVHDAAVSSASHDHPGRPRALTNLGMAYWRNGRSDEALECLHDAVKGHRDIGDQRGEARALGNVGLVYESLGRFTEALDHYRQVRDVYRATGDRRHETGLLINLGALCVRSGRPAEAAEHQREAVAIARAMDDRRLEGHILIGLGAACEGQGEYAEARQHLELALTISREYNHRRNEGYALGALGQVYLGLRQYVAAVEHLELARAIGSEVGDRLLETEALNSLGDTLRCMGNLSSALERYGEALELARQTGDRPEEARALEGTAHALRDEGESAQAEQLWWQALAIYTDMHLPQADRVRATLAG